MMTTKMTMMIMTTQKFKDEDVMMLTTMIMLLLLMSDDEFINNFYILGATSTDTRILIYSVNTGATAINFVSLNGFAITVSISV